MYFQNLVRNEIWTKKEQTEPRKNVTGSEKYPSKPKSFLRGNRHTFEKQKRKKLVFLVFGE